MSTSVCANLLETRTADREGRLMKKKRKKKEMYGARIDDLPF